MKRFVAPEVIGTLDPSLLDGISEITAKNTKPTFKQFVRATLFPRKIESCLPEAFVSTHHSEKQMEDIGSAVLAIYDGLSRRLPYRVDIGIDTDSVSPGMAQRTPAWHTDQNRGVNITFCSNLPTVFYSGQFGFGGSLSEWSFEQGYADSAKILSPMPYEAVIFGGKTWHRGTINLDNRPVERTFVHIEETNRLGF